MNPTAVVILAAGLGKRMKSDLPKVAVSTREKPMIQHVLSAAVPLKAVQTVIVTGYGREIVEEAVRAGVGEKTYSLDRVTFAIQEQQLGTGHAVKMALPHLKDFVGTVIILSGDVPLIRSETLDRLLQVHSEQKATISVISVHMDNPFGYGRIVRDTSGRYLECIVEQKDCTPEEVSIKEINSGIYAVDSAFLGPALETLTNNNAQGEFYLTDIVSKASAEGQNVALFPLHDPFEVHGVNTLYDLSQINRALLDRKIKELFEQGVVIEDPHSFYVDSSVVIQQGARIGPCVQIRGKSVIETGAIIEGSAYLVDTHVGELATIRFGVRSEGAKIGRKCTVGPFAHLRPQTTLGEEVKIGNFVETKNAAIGRATAASHLSYLGDCEIGEDTNIGAGTITCNYDGEKKHKTVIKDRVFIGSNSSLIAPLTIESDVVVGAGSVINKQDIEPNALAFSRPPLVVKPGYKNKGQRR